MYTHTRFSGCFAGTMGGAINGGVDVDADGGNLLRVMLV